MLFIIIIKNSRISIPIINTILYMLIDSKQKKKPKKNQTIPFDGDSNGSQTSISGMQMGATLRPVEGDRLARSNTLQRLNQQQLYSARNYGGNI